jgi:Eukaryotic cytochrome b561
MIVSWVGATSIGIFSARYLKTICNGKKLFGKDIWFIVHLLAMSLTWLLTIAAVVIIWVDVGERRTSTHSVLGIIATVLCFNQSLVAFFRPGPNDPARPIFNFMHGSVVKLAHFLACRKSVVLYLKF